MGEPLVCASGVVSLPFASFPAALFGLLVVSHEETKGRKRADSAFVFLHFVPMYPALIKAGVPVVESHPAD